jgi:hypothetical protein
LYLLNSADSTGQTLNCSNDYQLTFKEGDFPPIEGLGFWSLTMYNKSYNLVDNPIDRYSVGNRSEGLQLNDNGDLTIYVQGENPGGDKTANWLPCPEGEEFYTIIRLYIPAEKATTRQWIPPSFYKH